MSLPELLKNRLQIPAVAAPMFLASGPELVIETCKAGMVGSFPALNQRTSAGFEEWLNTINTALAAFEKDTGKQAAPFAVNLIVHKTNPRLEADLALCVKHKVPMIITSLGAVKSVIDAVHSYGGLVFHDVINPRHARKAADAGVDGLIAVCAGAGGHAGSLNPFALVAEIREFFDKTLLLAGAISKGSDIAAAQMMGADLAYMGTRFINTQESLVQQEYKQMIVDSKATDIVYTPNISGVFANFLKPSIENAGLDPNNLKPKTDIDFGQELEVDADNNSGDKAGGAWKQIWSAGQGVGSIDNIPSTAELVSTLINEYQKARSTLK
ncbi:NAD(P)H-dependent flavin oxidoreductase [Zhongshania arctica]|uniref:NAD(P)H-dependent flavin oxidoreductase n=1 Tax=Zhongshania arctica TaxID=3238302 RepID=A0ABV3TTW0_9GAMM|tara:strand:- start:13404 stop:14381 length:978 start_codon:yes stop_codon:yes gene_type:complete